MNPVLCTIAATNYLPRVRVLVSSIRRFNPGVPITVLIVGSRAGSAAARGHGIEVIRPEDLGLGVLPASMRGYDIKGLCAALKPTLMRHLLRRGHPSVIFLDPDMLVTRSLAPVFDVVGRHAMTLTPHLRSPRADPAGRALIRSIALAGTFNAGFIGVTGRPEVRDFLDWWEGRLRTHCVEAVGAGLHYDQRWLDLAVGFIEDLCLLRDPGCNAGYWNFEGHRWSIEAGELRVDGGPLTLFHFSGFDPEEPLRVSRHGDWHVNRIGPLGTLFRLYSRLLAEAGALPGAPASRPAGGAPAGPS